MENLIFSGPSSVHAFSSPGASGIGAPFDEINAHKTSFDGDLLFLSHSITHSSQVALGVLHYEQTI